MVNFETFFKHTRAVDGGDLDDRVRRSGHPEGAARDALPIHKVDRMRAPTIVLHGANDTNVPVVEAEQVVDALKKRGVPVEYMLFPDEGHGWRKTRTASARQWRWCGSSIST